MHTCTQTHTHTDIKTHKDTLTQITQMHVWCTHAHSHTHTHKHTHHLLLNHTSITSTDWECHRHTQSLLSVCRTGMNSHTHTQHTHFESPHGAWVAVLDNTSNTCNYCQVLSHCCLICITVTVIVLNRNVKKYFSNCSQGLDISMKYLHSISEIYL